METKADQLNKLQGQIQLQGAELRLLRGSSGDEHFAESEEVRLAHGSCALQHGSKLG